mmetsp:Transcript_26611/g.82291  ORF Transcript_26611/g.82291 Transcript_26611/m.82291 type:complete len:209 (-) Transcript_26611:28-654(-)
MGDVGRLRSRAVVAASAALHRGGCGVGVASPDGVTRPPRTGVGERRGGASWRYKGTFSVMAERRGPVLGVAVLRLPPIVPELTGLSSPSRNAGATSNPAARVNMRRVDALIDSDAAGSAAWGMPLGGSDGCNGGSRLRIAPPDPFGLPAAGGCGDRVVSGYEWGAASAPPPPPLAPTRAARGDRDATGGNVDMCGSGVERRSIESRRA